MAKRSKQRAARQKKDHTGCMWGLMSMFDFRHGRTTRRLLSDRRRYTTDNTHGSSYPTSEANLPTDSEEIHLSIEGGEKKIQKPALDLVRSRVKELIEDEIFVDLDSKKQNDAKKVESVDLECSSRVSNRKHPEKTSKKSVDHEISINRQVSAPKASQYHDLEALVKEILVIHQKKNNDQHGDLGPGAKRSFPIVEEKLIAAVEVLLNEKSNNGDLKQFRHSKELFQMLSSNKEMFLKLLQDQSSILLKEDQKSKSTECSNLLEPDDPVARKNRKFFRRRSKSQECISLNEKGKIVILKPGSPDNRNDIHGDGNGSQFSFMEIKRRLKQAMGKPGPGERSGKTVVDGGWSSPNRDHFYTERFARVANGPKTGYRASNLRDSETLNEDTNHRISNIYVEAKKHLSEMLTSGDEDAETMMRSLPKSLGRILSLRDYGSVSPGTSPREGFCTVNQSQPLTINDISEEKVVVCDDIASEGVLEIVKLTSCDQEQHEQMKEEMKEPDILCEPCSSSINDDHEAVVIVDGSNEERSFESLKPDLPDEKESSSSQTRIEPSLAGKNEELEITPVDRTGKPSPISVLEPLFSDDDISPARPVSRPVEAAIQPLCIRFEEPVSVSVSEDQQIRITDSADSEESAFEYVEAVLLSSDLNWSEFEKRWLSAGQVLDPSLFEEVEAFSGRARYDQRHLFDSTNEALEEVCDRFIPESPFIKSNGWPVPKGMGLINEVWARLESWLVKVYPRDLNKLVRNDLETPRMWLDLRSESHQIVIEIEESIFENAMDDILFEFIRDIRD